MALRMFTALSEYLVVPSASAWPTRFSAFTTSGAKTSSSTLTPATLTCRTRTVCANDFAAHARARHVEQRVGRERGRLEGEVLVHVSHGLRGSNTIARDDGRRVHLLTHQQIAFLGGVRAR